MQSIAEEDEAVLEADDFTGDCVNSGMIIWEIDKISQLGNARLYSAVKEVHGLPWRVVVWKEPLEGSDKLSVYMKGYENESLMWSIDVLVWFTLMNKNDRDNVELEIKARFNSTNSVWGYAIIDWDTLIGAEAGFICDDKITMKVRFTLSNIAGIRKMTAFDFTNSLEPCNDIVLIVGGKKLFCSKQMLSLHSPVLKAIFYGNIDERDNNEFELKGVEYEDFVEMLHVLYPNRKKITEETVERLLSIGDYFAIKIVLDKVEKFLITSTKINVAAKLKLSGDYRLVKLQGHCLKSLKTISDVTNLKRTKEYKEFSAPTKLALLEKIMNLAD